MTDQPHQQGLGGDKAASERIKAFNRGDLAHESAGPDHKPSTSDLTMQEYADGWGVSLKEAQRRFTQHRMNNPIAYPQTKNSTKASEITAAATEGMWADFSNRKREDDAKEQLSPNGPTPPLSPRPRK
mgnify:FL=1|jgi:hypothetical protein